MSVSRIDLMKWNTISLLGGTFIWGLLTFYLFDATLTSHLNLLLLFAILLMTPLVLGVIITPDRYGNHSSIYRIVVISQPFAAGLAIISFIMPTGILASLPALGWLLFTGLIALFGLVRLLPRGRSRIDEVCIDFGLLYLPIGGLWLVLSRAGFNPLGFGHLIVLLTAIHFHYISLTALVMAGLIGRRLSQTYGFAWRIYSLMARCLIVSPILVAIGITFSLTLEVLGAVLLAMSIITLTGLNLLLIIPKTRHSFFVKTLHLISSSTILLTMTLAALYALGRFTSFWTVTIPYMVQIHGLGNALGFGLCGLLAYRWSFPKSALPAPGIPFSKLSSRGRIGPHFFHHLGAVELNRNGPTGLVDSLDEYHRPDFATDQAPPSIRAFYETTNQFSLFVHPDWKPIFRLPAQIYKYFSAKLEQMNLPLHSESKEDLIESYIFPINDDLDGRTNVRAWVRVYNRTGKAVYVAAYANHSDNKQTYMNIAFPLPFGNLTSILHLESLNSPEGHKGIVLTSLSSSDWVGDEGVYFVNKLLPIRIPINETIRVWVGDGLEPNSPSFLTLPSHIQARHDMWLFGIQFLTLHYFISPNNEK